MPKSMSSGSAGTGMLFISLRPVALIASRRSALIDVKDCAGLTKRKTVVRWSLNLIVQVEGSGTFDEDWRLWCQLQAKKKT